MKLRFHRKGLNQNYEEDCLTLVLSENPVKLEGLIQFNEGYEFDFERYIDNELGIITLPEGTEMCMPGDNVMMHVELLTPVAMEEGLRFAIREGGRTVGSGVVGKIIE